MEKLKKSEFRRYFFTNRKQIPREIRDERDGKILASLLDSPLYKGSQTIFTYLSVDEEIDTRGLIRRGLADGKKIYIPKILGRLEMVPVRIRAKEDLVPGKAGIPTSKLDESIEEPDLILVPGFCFDKDFYRIGYGGGYYDYYLAKTSSPSLGLFYTTSQIEEIPRDDFDIPLKNILTEEGFLEK